MNKKNEAPMVSVVIPTFNRCGFLKEAIESVMKQTYPSWELIIVDDASTDNTRSFLQDIEDVRITKIYLDKNMGLSRARNVGLNQARGEFIHFLDDDDLLPKGALAAHIKNFRKYPKAVASIGSRVRFDGSGGRKLLQFTRKIVLRNIFWDVLFGWIAYSGQCFFLTEILRSIKGWADEYTVGEGEDQELLLRLSRQGPILLISDTVLLSRSHPGHLRQRGFEESEKQRMNRVRREAVTQMSGREYEKGKRYLKARNCFTLASKYYERGDTRKAFFFYSNVLRLAPSIISSPLIRRSVLSPMIKCAAANIGFFKREFQSKQRSLKQENSAVPVNVKYVN